MVGFALDVSMRHFPLAALRQPRFDLVVGDFVVWDMVGGSGIENKTTYIFECLAMFARESDLSCGVYFAWDTSLPIERTRG